MTEYESARELIAVAHELLPREGGRLPFCDRKRPKALDAEHRDQKQRIVQRIRDLIEGLAGGE